MCTANSNGTDAALLGTKLCRIAGMKVGSDSDDGGPGGVSQRGLKVQGVVVVVGEVGAKLCSISTVRVLFYIPLSLGHQVHLKRPLYSHKQQVCLFLLECSIADDNMHHGMACFFGMGC